jgi:phytanoyl-CoA dioxygenase PhyH
MRAVTAGEIEHYREFGWVKLQGLVAAETVQRLLRRGIEKLGEDGDSNPPLPILQDLFNHASADALTDLSLRPLLHDIGRSAKALMQRQPDVEVRYFTENYAVKLPAARQSRHAGNGRTLFHHDFPNWQLDRSGGMAFWIALMDMTPAMGTMSFVNGSHRLGVLGNYRNGDLLEMYPEIRERCTVTEPMTYKAGDATVHSNLTVHGAGFNLTDQPRWAYTVLVNPADARWTGAPAEAYDTREMKVHQQLDDERFPILSATAAATV